MIYKKCLHPITINGGIYNCGQCRHCKARRVYEWTIRGRDELLYNPNATFITLTYDEKHLKRTAFRRENKNDKKGTLCKRDLTLFIKRLRKKLSPKKIKYMACGEYGDQTFRPHYHIIIFGITPNDISKETLTKIWKLGLIDIDKNPITTKAIAYTVGYLNKKLKGVKHYEKNHREPPFQAISQGIGAKYADKYNWYHNLETGLGTKKASIPRYYINRIFKNEGKTITLNNTIIEIDITNHSNKKNNKYIVDGTQLQYKTRKTKQQKTFINPNGKKTKIILEKLEDQAIKSIERDKLHYNLSENEVEKLIEINKQKWEQKKIKIKSEWEDVNTLSENEIKEKYKHNTYHIAKRWKNKDWQFKPPIISSISQYINESKESDFKLFQTFQKIKKNRIDTAEELTCIINKI